MRHRGSSGSPCVRVHHQCECLLLLHHRPPVPAPCREDASVVVVGALIAARGRTNRYNEQSCRGPQVCTTSKHAWMTFPIANTLFPYTHRISSQRSHNGIILAFDTFNGPISSHQNSIHLRWLMGTLCVNGKATMYSFSDRHRKGKGQRWE
jgi:hypothetical protein